MFFTSEVGPPASIGNGEDIMATDHSGPQTGARKARKLRASRDGWKERAAEKQQEIKRLRVTVRDLLASRERWQSRVHDLLLQVQALQEAQASSSAASLTWIFFGG